MLALPATAGVATDRVLDALDAAIASPAARAVAVYHPWITVATPDGALRPVATVPPAGHVTGLISRLDRELGPTRTPAGLPLAGLVDVADGPSLAGRRVNQIRCRPGRGPVVWGGRTFDDQPGGRFLAHRRLVHRLVRAARAAAEPLVFEPQGPAMRRALVRAVTSVLLQAYRSGALAGHSDTEAFEVVCDATTTTADDGDSGRVRCEVNFTPADPMESITVVLSLAAEGRVEVIEE